MATVPPDAPQIYTLPLAENQQMSFYFTGPTSEGSSPIQNYYLTMSNQTTSAVNTYTVSPSQLPYYTVTGLTNGQTYTSYVQASNATDLGPAAYFREFQTGAGAPPAATQTATASAISGTTSALVSWTPPATLPDSTIFWYTIESSSTNSNDAVVSRTANGVTDTNIIVTGLNQNSLYTFTIKPVNCPGYGPALATNQIGFFSAGQAKLATYVGQSAGTIGSTSIGTDASGNVYVAFVVAVGTGPTYTIYNYASAPVSGGSVGTSVWGTITVTTAENIVLVKYNSSGTALWATRCGSPSNTSLFPPLAVDASGNVYIYNYARNNFVIYSFSSLSGGVVQLQQNGSLSLQTQSGTFNLYLIKYNTNGQAQWAVRTVSQYDGNSYMQYPQAAVDASGNVYLSASYSDYPQNVGSTTIFSMSGSLPVGSATVGETAYGRLQYGSTSPDAQINTVLIKYNSSGIVQKVAKLSFVSLTSNTFTAVTVDSSGNPILMGTAGGSRTITIQNDNGVSGTPPIIQFTNFGTITTDASGGPIIVKYNSSLTATFATRIGGFQANSLYLSCDSSNNVYVSYSQGNAATAIYSNTSGSGTGVTLYGTLTAFDGTVLYKMNSAFTVQWVAAIRGNANYPGISKVDSNGNFYIAVESASSVTPQNQNGKTGTTINLTAYGIIPFTGGTGADTYFMKYNTSGSVVWATRVAGTTSDRGPDCTVDTDGNAYICGIYTSNPVTISNYSSAPSPPGTGNVGLATFGTLPDSAGENVFLVKYQA